MPSYFSTWATGASCSGGKISMFRCRAWRVGSHATLTDFYPESSALPSSLTRFFWQKEMWSHSFRLGSILRTLSSGAIEQAICVVAGFGFSPRRVELCRILPSSRWAGGADFAKRLLPDRQHEAANFAQP